jgi:predicted transcriptional regulator of viral defense system
MRAYDRVHEIALDQHGLVTTQQAREHDIDPRTIVMMAKRGRLRRLTHGVYQDLGAPETRWTPYMAAVLWPQGTRGVLSHATALALMDISDVNPGEVHLTVPATFRTHRAHPAGVVLHRAELAREDVTDIEGLPVTTAARAIRDCAAAAIGPAFLDQALKDARAHGWLRGTDADALIAELREAGYL